MTRPFLIVDNTLPCDLPDLYDGIPDNDAQPLGQSIAFMLGGWAYRLWRVLPWVALGLCVGVMVGG